MGVLSVLWGPEILACICPSTQTYWTLLVRRKRVCSDLLLDTKLLNVATLPVRLMTSLGFLGELISKSTLIFSGLASIPCWFTIKPRNLPNPTTKVHFKGLSVIRYFHSYWTSDLNILCGLLPFWTWLTCRPHRPPSISLSGLWTSPSQVSDRSLQSSWGWMHCLIGVKTSSVKKEVCSSSGSFIGIWLYPKYVFMKLNSLCPIVVSMSYSIWGKRKLPLGHVLLRFMKSMHILYLPFGSITSIGLANQSG